MNASAQKMSDPDDPHQQTWMLVPATHDRNRLYTDK